LDWRGGRDVSLIRPGAPAATGDFRDPKPIALAPIYPTLVGHRERREEPAKRVLRCRIRMTSSPMLMQLGTQDDERRRGMHCARDVLRGIPEVLASLYASIVALSVVARHWKSIL
jgi:hypothetical protein